MDLCFFILVIFKVFAFHYFHYFCGKLSFGYNAIDIGNVSHIVKAGLSEFTAIAEKDFLFAGSKHYLA